MLSNKTRYQPVENGYGITGSREVFNRTLYGSHANDDRQERYFTFAGDLPLVMGAVTDWSKNTWGNYAKSGMLMSGLALTPGVKHPSFCSEDMDTSSQWFHHSEDVVTVFHNGWMEYECRQFSPWFPDVKVDISVFPLMPEDGFLVHYKIKTDQRVIFCAGFGGMTDFLSRLEYPQIKARNFHASDCKNNTVRCGRNRALLKGAGGNAMWIGSRFSVDVAVAEALSLQDASPGIFLGSENVETSTPVVKMSCPIGQGEVLDGYIVAIRNESEAVLDQWLNHENPMKFLKQQIHAKQSVISMVTPDAMLNQTVSPTVLAMDASWHKNAFYHGAHAYHAPFLGWRNWYGPTVVGWHDRVKKAIRAHFSEIVKDAPGKEAVWYDGKDRPDLDHEGSQYHQIKNSTGFIPAFLGKNDIYNMQEVAVDMVFHHLQRLGDLKFAKELFDDLAGILDWEERILDPDNDGLYQNFLNTWISDGHSYNGGGCAQASAYNYHANLMMAKIAEKIDRPSTIFQKRTEKIRKAVLDRLWMPQKGLMAEFVDTIGNKLLHPSPELSTIYLAINCGLVDDFQAYSMLRFTQTDLRNERTLNRKGRLVYSSNWYPRKYSTCGLFPAENLHLALVYFKLGLKTNGLEILDAIVESYFMGKNPGMAAHVLTAHGVSDGGDLDFSDVSSMYLRVMVEGLYGIRFHMLDGQIEIAPNFPDAWTHADIKLKDLSLHYSRDGCQENLTFHTAHKATKTFKLPLRSTQIESVFLNHEPVGYAIEPGVNGCSLVVKTTVAGLIHLQVYHGDGSIPVLGHPSKIVEGNDLVIDLSNGKIIDCQDPSAALQRISFFDNKLHGEVKGEPGSHTIFLRVQDCDYDAWLAADIVIENKVIPAKPIALRKNTARTFEPMDISAYFNTSLTEIHTQKYLSPRPKGYSIGVALNGRYAWDWNHGGHNAVCVEDTALRKAKNGFFKTPSGLRFATPPSGPNVACVSLWDNFPTMLEIPLTGKAAELAFFFIGVTNAMQCWVNNASICVVYRDESSERVNLVHLENFDDWLTPSLQAKNETVYFSEYNHGLVQRITLDPKKDLASVTLEVIANEVILGLLGLSVRRK